MFGTITAPVNALSEEERIRYRSVYCGLCRRLGELHGQASRLSLTYDMTFLTLLLQSLYEPQEETGELRCLPHPLKAHAWSASEATDYAADLSVLLTRAKCLDDWQDDHALPQRTYAGMLKPRCAAAEKRWPRQAEAIRTQLKVYRRLEQEHAAGDALCACFGSLTAELFVWHEDLWAPVLRQLGHALGEFIVLMDAAVDHAADQRHHRFNALTSLDLTPETAREPLLVLMGCTADLFERLPLEQDLHLLRSILYAGVWQRYQAAIGSTDQDQRQEIPL